DGNTLPFIVLVCALRDTTLEQVEGIVGLYEADGKIPVFDRHLHFLLEERRSVLRADVLQVVVEQLPMKPRAELLELLVDGLQLLRSEEHTSELQSRENLVCRPLLEKNKKTDSTDI